MGSFLGREAAESDPWKACQGPTELFGLQNVHRIGRARDMWSTYGVNTTETMAKNKHSCCGWRLENETSQRGGLSTHVFFSSFFCCCFSPRDFVCGLCCSDSRPGIQSILAPLGFRQWPNSASQGEGSRLRRRCSPRPGFSPAGLCLAPCATATSQGRSKGLAGRSPSEKNPRQIQMSPLRAGNTDLRDDQHVGGSKTRRLDMQYGGGSAQKALRLTRNKSDGVSGAANFCTLSLGIWPRRSRGIDKESDMRSTPRVWRLGSTECYA